MNPFDVSRTIGNNLGQAERRRDEGNAIERILSQVGDDPGAIKNAIGQILSSVSPERQGAAVKYLENTLQNVRKNKQEQGQRRAVEEIGINPNLPPNLQNAQFNVNNRTPPKEIPKKLSARENYEDIRAAKEMEKIENNFREGQIKEGTLDRLNELSNELQGKKGWNPLSKTAAEFNALGLLAIEKPLKVFNPVGAIPTAKIKFVESKFAPKWSDTHSVAQGKIAAGRFMNQVALDMGKRLSELENKYGRNVPLSAINKLTSEISREGKEFVDYLENASIDDIAMRASQDKKTLTNDLLDKFMIQANNNPDEAERLAKAEGYTW